MRTSMPKTPMGVFGAGANRDNQSARNYMP
jgi:hypothetical protein